MRDLYHLRLPSAHGEALRLARRGLSNWDDLILPWLDLGQEGIRILCRRGPRLYADPREMVIYLLPSTRERLKSAAAEVGGSPADIIRHHLERLHPELCPALDFAAKETRPTSLSLATWAKLESLSKRYSRTPDEILTLLIHRKPPRLS